METLRILVVDNKPNVRFVLKAALEPSGYAVDEAVNGADALARIQTSIPDVMVLDLRMPGVDGLGVLEQIRQWPDRRRPRAIVLSSHGSASLAARAIRLGASDFLEKPVTPQNLRLSVAAALEEKWMSTSVAGTGDEDSRYGASRFLGRLRLHLASGRLIHAEELIMHGARLATSSDAHVRAAYLNLLGVLHEANGRLIAARVFYRNAIAADRGYKPPQDNAWRIYDLLLEGRTPIPLALGDRAELEHLAHGDCL